MTSDRGMTASRHSGRYTGEGALDEDRRFATDAGSTDGMPRMLAVARSLRWERPDLTAGIAGHVVASEPRDAAQWLVAAGWLVHGAAATGDPRPHVVEVLHEALAPGGPDLGAAVALRLRSEVAAASQDNGDGVLARGLAEAVVTALEAEGADPELRLDARLVLARTVLAENGSTAVEAHLDAAARTAGQVAHPAGHAAVALLAAVAERTQGRRRAALARIREGLRFLGVDPADFAGRAASRHLADALASQWIGLLLDSGDTTEVRDLADRVAARPAPPVATRQAAQLRLELARATGADASSTAAALEEAAEVAAAADVPALEAACRGAFAELAEQSGQLDGALAAMRAGVVAERRDRERGRQLQAAVARLDERLRAAAVAGSSARSGSDGGSGQGRRSGSHRADESADGRETARTGAPAGGATRAGTRAHAARAAGVAMRDVERADAVLSEAATTVAISAAPASGTGAAGAAANSPARTDAPVGSTDESESSSDLSGVAAPARHAGRSGGAIGADPAAPLSDATRSGGTTGADPAAPLSVAARSGGAIGADPAARGRDAGLSDVMAGTDLAATGGSGARRVEARGATGATASDSTTSGARHRSGADDERARVPESGDIAGAWWIRDASWAPGDSPLGEALIAELRSQTGAGRGLADGPQGDQREPGGSPRHSPGSPEADPYGGDPLGVEHLLKRSPASGSEAAVTGSGGSAGENGGASAPQGEAAGGGEDWLRQAIAELDRAWGPAPSGPDHTSEGADPSVRNGDPGSPGPGRSSAATDDEPGVRARAGAAILSTGASVVLDVVDGTCRLETRGAARVLRSARRTLEANLPRGARLRQDGPSAFTVLLPGWGPTETAAWLHPVLRGLAAALEDDAPAGMQLRGTVRGADGAPGAQLLQDLDGGSAAESAPSPLSGGEVGLRSPGEHRRPGDGTEDRAGTARTQVRVGTGEDAWELGDPGTPAPGEGGRRSRGEATFRRGGGDVQAGRRSRRRRVVDTDPGIAADPRPTSSGPGAASRGEQPGGGAEADGPTPARRARREVNGTAVGADVSWAPDAEPGRPEGSGEATGVSGKPDVERARPGTSGSPDDSGAGPASSAADRIEDETAKLGLGDLLAGALAAYRGL